MKRNKILFIATRNFFPTDSGDKLHSLSILKKICINNDVHLLNFLDSNPYEASELAQLNELCYKVSLYKSPKYSIFNSLLNTIKGYTWMIAKRRNLFTKNKIKTIIENENHFDVIIWDHLRSTANFVPNNSFNTLFEHNNELKIIKNMYDINKNIFLKILLYIQSTLMEKYLNSIYQYFERIVYVTKEDMEYSNSKKYQYLKYLVLSFEHQDFEDTRSSSIKLLFVGSLDWYPNINGIKWFINNVYSDMEKNFPNFELNIVGRNPSIDLEKLIFKYKKIHLHKNVQSVESFFLNSDIFINPIFDGGGINVKILEALSYGIPIVSTSFGLRGYANARFIPTANYPKEFLDEIGKLQTEYYQTIIDSELKYYNQYQEKLLIEIQKFLP